jgi:hypothetical protein
VCVHLYMECGHVHTPCVMGHLQTVGLCGAYVCVLQIRGARTRVIRANCFSPIGC